MYYCIQKSHSKEILVFLAIGVAKIKAILVFEISLVAVPAGAVPQSTVVEASTLQLAGPSKSNVVKSSVHPISFPGLGGNSTKEDWVVWHPAPATSESITDFVNIPGRSW
jgi:hypothetical protein